MSKKIMLITGASRGIGKQIHDRYKDEYECVTVHRSPGATMQGNLVDWKFREQVIKDVNPDVVINNAGYWGFALWGIAVNGVAAAHLMMGFHKKMERGHIITISSLRSSFQGYEKNKNPTQVIYDDIAYNCGKAMATSCSMQLSLIKNKPVNVVCIEPGVVKTDMYPNMMDPEYADVDKWTNDMHTPLMPSDIVNTVEWILQQPPWINLNLIRMNTNSILK